MLRFREACNGCQFYFPASLIGNLLVKTISRSYYLKLSLPVCLKCFLIFAQFQPHVSYRDVSYKKRAILRGRAHWERNSEANRYLRNNMFAPVRCCFDVMFLLFASLFAPSHILCPTLIQLEEHKTDEKTQIKQFVYVAIY